MLWFIFSLAICSIETPLYVAESLITDNAIGMLPVVSSSDELLGVVSRTDVLVQRRLWHPNAVVELNEDGTATDGNASVLSALSSAMPLR
jgi:predicted transcriptional regulator